MEENIIHTQTKTGAYESSSSLDKGPSTLPKLSTHRPSSVRALFYIQYKNRYLGILSSPSALVLPRKLSPAVLLCDCY